MRLKTSSVPMRTCRRFNFLHWLVAIFVALNLQAVDSHAGLLGSGRIGRQDPPRVTARLKDAINQDNSYVIISLSKQRAFLMVDGQTYIDTPISSGKRAGMTPTGSFHVLEKDPNHRSSVYGAFCDKGNRIVREGVSTRIDSAPAGTHYIGAPMKWFCRLTSGGVGMHVGILPGYPASHGCVRLPANIAPLIYEKVKVGTPVTIQD
jgi:lipoprotein-anchoring transpeptidase ErfK/SrfK